VQRKRAAHPAVPAAIVQRKPAAPPAVPAPLVQRKAVSRPAVPAPVAQRWAESRPTMPTVPTPCGGWTGPALVQRKVVDLRAIRPGRPSLVQLRPSYSHRLMAESLHAMSTDALARAKAIDNGVMEVQISKLDGKYQLSSNTAGHVNDFDPLDQTIAAAGLTFDRKAVTASQMQRVGGNYHAEQNILRALAGKLLAAADDVGRLGTLPQNVFVVGSKKPCTVCRRVLRAFRHALAQEYPAVSLHFVDESGQRTEVAPLDLSGINAGGSVKFAAFQVAYAAELARILAPALPGEDVAPGARMAAPIDFDELT